MREREHLQAQLETEMRAAGTLKMSEEGAFAYGQWYICRSDELRRRGVAEVCRRFEDLIVEAKKKNKRKKTGVSSARDKCRVPIYETYSKRFRLRSSAIACWSSSGLSAVSAGLSNECTLLAMLERRVAGNEDP